MYTHYFEDDGECLIELNEPLHERITSLVASTIFAVGREIPSSELVANRAAQFPLVAAQIGQSEDADLDCAADLGIQWTV